MVTHAYWLTTNQHKLLKAEGHLYALFHLDLLFLFLTLKGIVLLSHHHQKCAVVRARWRVA